MATKNKVETKRKKRVKKVIKILLIIALVIGVLSGIMATVNVVSNSSNSAFIVHNVKPVQYDHQLQPEVDKKGRYYFTTDRDFKILQITDVHIGGGWLSVNKDTMALNAVAAMITAEKPDLVIVTGDVAYPVPYQSGTFNNRESAKVFATLMEQLGVYWCMCFGNHDTELYSYFNRDQIAEMYKNKEKFKHCLLQQGPEDVDGSCNYVVNVKNTDGKITQSLFIFDSHSYVDGDYFGIKWKYDCIHENQVQWYKDTVKELTRENNGDRPKSLAFFHIPPIEMQEAFDEYTKAGNKDTENVKYKYGIIGEGGQMICSSKYNYGAFDAFRENGTQGVFFGHDHLNNMSLNYKGVQLTYGYSIDYLAYSGISEFGRQRGCTVIMTHPNGGFAQSKENYYQDKYVTVDKKEKVDLQHEMSEVNGGISNPLSDD